MGHGHHSEAVILSHTSCNCFISLFLSSSLTDFTFLLTCISFSDWGSFFSRLSDFLPCDNTGHGIMLSFFSPLDDTVALFFIKHSLLSVYILPALFLPGLWGLVHTHSLRELDDFCSIHYSITQGIVRERIVLKRAYGLKMGGPAILLNVLTSTHYVNRRNPIFRMRYAPGS